ncbi:MAG: YhjD/YihY/BrkB family envelope integrity protein [Thermoanaerobaculia bacterium]
MTTSEDKQPEAEDSNRFEAVGNGSPRPDPCLAVEARPKGDFAMALLFVREVGRGFLRTGATGRAAALAYTTLLSLIPLTVALWSVGRVFFVREFPNMQAHLDTVLNVVVPYQSSQITAQLVRATENASALPTVGLVVFILIAFKLFGTVETIVNMSWRIEKARTIRQKFRAFTMLFFWGPLVIGLSFAATSLFERSPRIGPFFQQDLVQWALPLLVFFLAFTMLFWLVPATRVRIRSAAIGAAVTTAAFEFVRFALAIYVAWLYRGTFDLVYGTIGLIVMFLIALELTWLVILLGVEVSYVHQNLDEIARAAEIGADHAPSFDLYFGLLALVEVCLAHGRREQAPRTAELSRHVSAPPDQTLELLERLERKRFVARSGGDDERWVPACDPDSVAIHEVVEALEEGGRRRVPRALPRPDCAGERAVASLLATLDAGLVAAAGERTLGQLVDEVTAKPPADGIIANEQ